MNIYYQSIYEASQMVTMTPEKYTDFIINYMNNQILNMHMEFNHI